MLSWNLFAAARPDLAGPLRDLLYQHGVGLAYLATVGADGGPRVHPICPLLTEQGLYAFVMPGPKQRDLHRTGRFALHSFPREDDEDAAYLVGAVTAVDDGATRYAHLVRTPGPDEKARQAFLLASAQSNGSDVSAG